MMIRVLAWKYENCQCPMWALAVLCCYKERYILYSYFDGLQNRIIKMIIVTAGIAVSIDGTKFLIWFPA